MHWGEGPNVALQAKGLLEHELSWVDETRGILETYPAASGILLEAIGNGLPCLDARNEPVMLSKLGVFGLTFPGGDDVGLEVATGDGERWASVRFEARDIMRRWPSKTSETSPPPCASKAKATPKL